MDEFLKIAKLQSLKNDFEVNGVTIEQLYGIMTSKTQKMVEKFKSLLPEAKLFDCHRLKATLQDIEKSGKIEELIKTEQAENESKAQLAEMSLITKKNQLKNISDLKEVEMITPDKKNYGKSNSHGLEALKCKKKQEFKRRESLNKKGWSEDKGQMKIDQFLVPRKRKRIDDSRFMMMGCSDSYS